MSLTVSEAVENRNSTRAFLRDRIPTEKEVRRLLQLSLRAPSGGNTQPWHFYVLAGAERDSLCRKAREMVMSGHSGKSEYAIYPPAEASKEYMTRRRKLGYDMYSLMGIDRKDKAGRMAAMLENYDFFGAPVGIIVTVDRIVDKNGWGHVGGLLQTICLLAAERGMATCLQEAWGTIGAAVASELQVPDSEIVWCGIALGYADPSKPVNSLRADREPLEKVSHFSGFGSKNKL